MPTQPLRAALAALLAAACASASAPDAVPQALRGCWIERRGADTITMRWFPAEHGDWRGDLLHYAPDADPEPQVFRIVAAAGEREQWGWALCPEAHPTDPPCRALSFGGVGLDVVGAEIRVTGDALRLALVDSGQRLLLFDGRRDGCD